MEQVYNDKCPHLQNKAKVFLFPACRFVNRLTSIYVIFAYINHALLYFRGPKEDGGVLAQSLNTIKTDCSTESLATKKPSQLISTVQNVFICYGTTPNYTAFRHRTKGSCFVQAFVLTLAKYSYKRDLDRLMKKVQKKLTKITKKYKINFQSMTYEQRGTTKIFYMYGRINSYHLKQRTCKSDYVIVDYSTCKVCAKTKIKKIVLIFNLEYSKLKKIIHKI